ncbi:uncharacterized protein [Symphalangus syndactylus]|uniref:uncharacterized protein isoform X1 n=1 Tax=Symphalangus syndactylus TaxID=9590 RepID=UPI003007E484
MQRRQDACIENRGAASDGCSPPRMEEQTERKHQGRERQRKLTRVGREGFPGRRHSQQAGMLIRPGHSAVMISSSRVAPDYEGSAPGPQARLLHQCLGGAVDCGPVFSGSTSPRTSGRKASYATILTTACQPQRLGLAARPGKETAVACTAQGSPGPRLPLSMQVQDALLTNTWGKQEPCEGGKNSTVGNRESFSKSSGSYYSLSMGYT